MDWSQSEAQELPNTSIVPEMAGDWTPASHELADTYISEMVGTECPIELGDGMPNWEDNFYAENFDEWHLPELPVVSKGESSPKLFLDTSVAQATPSLNWTNTPLSAAIISPMSAVLQCDSTRSAVEISPTDSEASGNSFFTDSGYSSATTLSASYSPSSFQRFPSLVSVTDRKEKKRETGFEVVSEEWINDTVCSVALPVPDVAALPPPHLEPIFEDPPKIMHPAGRCTEYPNTKFASPHWHDPTSLVQSFLDVLDSHIKHTEHALQGLPLTTTTEELMSMSRTSMASVGLEVLAGILAGRHPTATVQVFAFTHVACALAIAIDDSEAKIHTQRWFQDSLNWASGLQGEKQKRGYEVIAKAIWEPLELLGPNSSLDLVSDSGENCLLASCKHFLDLFESLDSPKSPIYVPSSSPTFDFAQSSFKQRAKTHIIEELIRKPRIEAFIEDVVRVEARLSQGLISNIRQLELELICAGKLASQSDRAYARFLEHVTALCDVLYREEPSGVARTKCQLWSARRIMVLMLQEVCGVASEHGWKGSSGFHELSDDDEDLLPPFLDMDFRSYRGRKTDLEFDTPNRMAALNANADDLLLLRNDHYAAIQHHHYAPAGEHKWKASNLRRHQRIQHPNTVGESKVYVCRWRGCQSRFTRSDNLRCHVRDKGHFEGVGEASGGKRMRRAKAG
ncbi:zinc finger protein [Drepanopeziza brunnea f. sp. 'multigermtubi' MB_m1]|uniref:Zinc finger protein n=1 Tax=Marssonina brunnea f. sp. multigermtubi (strain MB_m1) TaxID=1072389 RepID=K1XQ35_MARBU|nr:zinc finger protein [Drepanopeziza brunnea f. sp. 'multigermtubi' MB_m1]EKD14634.1 zinc finger protein [Drepanopeziza brunnea f. sp. 'multigermtubi' MB_m1]